jgi:hypothetical protein
MKGPALGKYPRALLFVVGKFFAKFRPEKNESNLCKGNSFPDNHHFGYITKSNKKNTGVAPQGHLKNFGDLDKEHRGVLISVHYRSTNIDLDSVF